jgi:hypothetical protein
LDVLPNLPHFGSPTCTKARSSQPQNFHLFILIVHNVLPLHLQLQKHANQLHFTTFSLQRQLVKCINSKHILPPQSLFSSIPIYHMPYILKVGLRNPTCVLSI